MSYFERFRPALLDTAELQSVLIETRELIQAEWHWTQEFEARDKWGINVVCDDKAACMWCLQGALKRVTAKRDVEFNVAAAAIVDVIPIEWFEGTTAHSSFAVDSVYDSTDPTPLLSPYEYLVEFNDLTGRRHSEVLEVLDVAIATWGGR